VILGLTNGPVHVQQTLSKFIYRGAPEEDQVVTIFGLGEEQPVLTDGFAAFAIGEEGSEGCQPFETALQQILGSQRIGQLLQLFRM
jgi:hypothetical protein